MITIYDFIRTYQNWIELNLSLDGLQNHFCNLQVQEVLVLKQEQEKFDPKKDTPEKFLVILKGKEFRAYPTQNFPVVAPQDPAGSDSLTEGVRISGETTHSLE